MAGRRPDAATAGLARGAARSSGSTAQPDGITRAAFRFESGLKFQESQFGRWSGRKETEEATVTVAPQRVSPEELETRPTVALASCLLQLHSISASQNWESRLLASYWPANPDGCLAVACSKLRGRLDDAGLVFEAVPGWMAPLQAVDQGWSEMARTALWLGLLSRNDQSRGTSIDALIEGIADGRADTAALVDTLLHIASGGWIKLNRLADSLREVTRTSILAERVVAEVMDRLIASWTELPRDGHHVLALQMELLNNLQQGLSPAARESLSTVKGTGKAAKLAKQLSGVSLIPRRRLREAAVQAVEGRLRGRSGFSSFSIAIPPSIRRGSAVGPACRAHDYPQLFTKLCKIYGTVRERSRASRFVAIGLRACCIVVRGCAVGRENPFKGWGPTSMTEFLNSVVEVFRWPR